MRLLPPLKGRDGIEAQERRKFAISACLERVEITTDYNCGKDKNDRIAATFYEIQTNSSLAMIHVDLIASCHREQGGHAAV